jgi:hypothetical protein
MMLFSGLSINFRFFMNEHLKAFLEALPDQQGEGQKCPTVQDFQQGGMAGEGGLGGSQCSGDEIQELINEYVLKEYPKINKNSKSVVPNHDLVTHLFALTLNFSCKEVS